MMDIQAENRARAFTFEHVARAADGLRGKLRQTPLEPAPDLATTISGEVRLKLENLQLSGSFKIRGALNVLAELTPEQRARGVIAPTAGNHGLGLAEAGTMLGVPISIYLPRATDPMKIARLKALGADVTLFGMIEEARQAALSQSRERGMTFVSAYDHPAMIAGGGTVGLDIVSKWPEVDLILVPIGGGGLASGVATAVKELNPKAEVWAVQSAASPTFARWKAAGSPVPLTLRPSMAEGVSGDIETSTMTFPLVRDRVDRVVLVSEDAIASAMGWLQDHHGYLAEPSGAVAIAGAFAERERLAGRKVSVVVTGRNISTARYQSILAPLVA